MKKKKRGRKRRERTLYKFAVPMVMFVATVAAVLIWNYSTNLFGNRFRGFAANGKLGEVALAFFGEPAILAATAGVLMLSIASFAVLSRALKEKRSGALLLTVLLIVSDAAFAAIIYTAIAQIAK